MTPASIAAVKTLSVPGQGYIDPPGCWNSESGKPLDLKAKYFVIHYEAMKDVLPQLILSDSNYKRYQVARAKNIIPPFELLIELVDYIPADIALATLRSKEDFINYGWEMDVYLYAIKKFDTEETKQLRKQRRKAEREAKIAELGLDED